MSKVYFAASFSMKDQIAEYAKELREDGIIVTSRWLAEPEPTTVQIYDLPPEKHEFYGTQDVEDVHACDVMVSFNDPEQHFRQGRTAEFGMVVMLNHLSKYLGTDQKSRPIFVVGDNHEHIFHYQPHVYHFPDWEKAKMGLKILFSACPR